MMRLRRTRWMATGAVVAAAIAGGGVMMLQATGAESSFVPVTPTRVLDTRINVGLTGKFVHDTARLLTVTGSVATTGGTVVVVPTGATAVVMNVTVVGPTASGFFSVRPGDASGAPTTSSLNFAAGSVVPNAVTVELPAAGNVNLYYFGSAAATTDVLIDVVGYYIVGTPGAAGADGSNGVSGSNFGREVIYTANPQTGDLGLSPSMAIGVDGLPIIVHRDDSISTARVRVTHCSDTACATSTSLELEADNGWANAIAVGSDGLPVIARSTTSSDLKLTHCSDVLCSVSTSTTFTTGVLDGFVPSIAIGADGFPIVAHRDSGGGLWVSHCADVACTSLSVATTKIDTLGGNDPSIAIGTDGFAIIAHRDSITQDLRVTHCSNSACTASTNTAVDTASAVGFEPSIAIGTDGLAIIAHRDDTVDDLRVTHCSNVTCTAATHTTVDVDANMIGFESAITIGVDGFAVIAHRSSSTSNLRITQCGNVACTSAVSTEINTTIGDGNDPSILTGRDSHVMVAYRAASSGGLRVTKILHMSWTVNGWES